MAFYTKQFTKPYPNGYVDKPQKTTPVTADILNMQDNVFSSIEDFLTSEDIDFKNKLTIGTRNQNITQGNFTLTVGKYNIANGEGSVVFGRACYASGAQSYAEGDGNMASASNSHAEGAGTIASGVNQHVQGKYNISDTENKFAHIVGGGTSNSSRTNIHTVDWQGNAIFAGDVTNGNGVSLDGLMALVGTTGRLRTIVDTLPETDISTDTIYMVPKESSKENDIYNEYINTDGTPEGWEFIGNSAVDLSNYYTRDQMDQMLDGYVAAETGKDLSSNDYTDADMEIVESIRNMTAAGALAILNETEGEAQ